jgi:hypothetical protein
MKRLSQILDRVPDWVMALVGLLVVGMAKVCRMPEVDEWKS